MRRWLRHLKSLPGERTAHLLIDLGIVAFFAFAAVWFWND